MRSVSLIFSVDNPRKWKGLPIIQQATTNVWARSGEFTKSYSSRGTQRPLFFSVTTCSRPDSFDSKIVFTPSRLKMYFTTESPCFEPSISPDSRIVASRSFDSATISYQ